MVWTDIGQRYFDWMCDKVIGDLPPRTPSFHRLLAHLHDRRFVPSMPLDEKRAVDAVDMRYRFASENDISYAKLEYEFAQADCSMLEMMIALAVKMEEHILEDNVLGDRTGEWFWNMIISLGLEVFTDAHYDEDRVNYILDQFDARMFDKNGAGSLFTVEEPIDMRDLDIWYQAMHWIRENVD